MRLVQRQSCTAGRYASSLATAWEGTAKLPCNCLEAHGGAGTALKYALSISRDLASSILALHWLCNAEWRNRHGGSICAYSGCTTRKIGRRKAVVYGRPGLLQARTGIHGCCRDHMEQFPDRPSEVANPVTRVFLSPRMLLAIYSHRVSRQTDGRSNFRMLVLRAF